MFFVSFVGLVQAQEKEDRVVRKAAIVLAKSLTSRRFEAA
jgi:hypothetical protein